MRVLAIVHQRDAGAGVFAEAIAEAGGELEQWTPVERPQPPADPFGYDAILVLGGAMNVDEGERDPLLGPLAPSFEAFQWHSYEFSLPRGAVPLASSEVCLQACRLGERAWALQFHPEVSRADALHWIDDTGPTLTRYASGSIPPSSDRRPRRRSTPSTSSAVTSAGAG